VSLYFYSPILNSTRILAKFVLAEVTHFTWLVWDGGRFRFESKCISMTLETSLWILFTICRYNYSLVVGSFMLVKGSVKFLYHQIFLHFLLNVDSSWVGSFCLISLSYLISYQLRAPLVVVQEMALGAGTKWVKYALCLIYWLFFCFPFFPCYIIFAVTAGWLCDWHFSTQSSEGNCFGIPIQFSSIQFNIFLFCHS
jgi:hypothetical protein